MGRPSRALDTGVLYCDDNLNRMATLPSESVDLIYLDPPFFSNRVYEVIWGDEAEVRSFEDRWDAGINGYIEWMRHRLMEIHRLLKPTGSLYLHCDPHASHYLKVSLDDIFGIENFRSEVIWKRSSAHNSANRFGPVHDTILFYTKSRKYTWNKVFQALPQETIDQWYNNFDAEGRRYNRADLTAAGTRTGQSGAQWRGVDPTAKGRHWAIPGFVGSLVAGLSTMDALDALDAAGRIHWPKRGGSPMLKRYIEESNGVPAQDVITDVRPLNNSAAERLGYPTQKPEALLARLLAASTNPGDVVLDPFCGCGTTVTVAEKMKRQWIGIDISPTAVNIMDRRIKRVPGARHPVLIGLPSSVEALRALRPFEFQNWVIQQFYGVSSSRKSGDMGIDGYTFLTHDPIQVKQSEKVGRNVVDNFETAVKRDGSDIGWIVAFSFTRGAREEAARARWEEKLDIKLVTVADLLKPKPERRGLLWPEPATVAQIPLSPPRDPREISYEELVRSARAASA